MFTRILDRFRDKQLDLSRKLLSYLSDLEFVSLPNVILRAAQMLQRKPNELIIICQDLAYQGHSNAIFRILSYTNYRNQIISILTRAEVRFENSIKEPQLNPVLQELLSQVTFSILDSNDLNLYPRSIIQENQIVIDPSDSSWRSAILLMFKNPPEQLKQAFRDQLYILTKDLFDLKKAFAEV